MSGNPEGYFPIESTQKDSLIELVYHQGMYYIQQSIIAKQRNDENQSKEFLDKFYHLVDNYDPSDIPEITGQKNLDLLIRSSSEYWSLEDAIKKLLSNNPDSYSSQYGEIANKCFHTCQVLTNNLVANKPAPNLVEVPLVIQEKILNPSIPKGKVIIFITDFQVNKNSTSKFELEIIIPGEEEFVTDIQPGRLNVAREIKVFPPNISGTALERRMNRFLELDLKFRIYRIKPGVLFFGDKKLLIASYTISMRYFREKSKFSEFIEFKAEKDADKDEICKLQVDLITNEAFNKKEIEETSFMLHLVNQAEGK